MLHFPPVIQPTLHRLIFAVAFALVLTACNQGSVVASPAGSATEAHWSLPPEPSKSAPNILLVLTDDVGFAATETFGGFVPTPNLNRLADSGLRFTNFHTTAMCSPTRAALLTGRNSHAVGFGAIADMPMGFPGYNTELPDSARTLPEILRRAGYATAMFGKLHLTPNWERGLSGPFDRWPTGLGFNYFYGFIAADSDQWRPTVFRNTTLVDASARSANRLLDQDLADEAIHWIHQAKADAPERPFFVYFSPGSAHAPHQAPKEWIQRFSGKFDDGWDALRAKAVEKQKAAGVVPQDADVTPRPGSIPAWDSLPKAQRRLFSRYMEVFAAQLAFQDAQFGRLLAELDRMGERDNTLIVFIQGDNGGSGEGGPEGSINELRKLAQQESRFTEIEASDLDRLGGPESYEIFQAGWAWATNAPFPLFKQNASHLGGTRNGMVIAWAGHVAKPGRIVNRFQHVTDIAPTLLAAAGVQAPEVVDGVKQQAMAGGSLLDSLEVDKPQERSRRQYFEMLGNRALYSDGWWANTTPGRMPWEAHSRQPAEAFEWELYDLRSDFAQARNVADKFPEKLREMKALWEAEAKRNGVHPLRADLDVNEIARLGPPVATRNEFSFWGSGVHLPWTAQPNLLRGSFSVDVDFSAGSAKQASGTLFATGSLMGGWSLALRDGYVELSHAASEARADFFVVRTTVRVGAGEHNLHLSFVADSDLPGSGGTVEIAIDGAKAGSGRVERRGRPASSNELFDVGEDTGVHVVRGQREVDAFRGTIHRLIVRLGS